MPQIEEDTPAPIRAEWKCPCGLPAVTEIQIGWNHSANAGAGGGVYDPACEKCYDDYCNGQ